jgi:hypothetical protein
MSLLASLRRAIRLCAAWFRPGRHLAVQRILDEPEIRERGVLYVVGDRGAPWLVVMTCPCGCGQPIHLNLLRGARPRWTLTEHGDATVSLRPSVWRTCGCESHFHLKRSCIVWVGRRSR